MKSCLAILPLILLLILTGCENPETAIFIDNPEFIPDSGIYQQAMLDNMEKIIGEYDISRFKGSRVVIDSDTNGLKATGKILTSLIDIQLRENGITRVIPDRSGRVTPPDKKAEVPRYEIFIDIIASGGHVSRCIFFDRYYSTVYVNFSELDTATGVKSSKIIHSESGRSFNILTTLFCRVLYLGAALFGAVIMLMRLNRRIL